MKGKYIFIANSTKPTKEIMDSCEGDFISSFNESCIRAAISLGYDVYLGVNRAYPEKLMCNKYSIKYYNANTFRSIFNLKDNYKAYKNLSALLKEGNVKVIHCNTPVGGMIGRICGRKYNISKVIYTAHGFHFFKGAPLFNNTILKWAEYIMAHWTDVIITMNEEDYLAAKKMKIRGGRVYKTHGVGIDLSYYDKIQIDKCEYRKSLGLSMDDFICIATGDLIKRKNFITTIQAVANCNNKKIHYLICGNGIEKESLIKLSKNLNVENQIHFLGFRNDITELLFISDCFLFASLQEGLSRSVMEAMASGLPCIISDIRGNKDLVVDGENGFLVPAKDAKTFATCISNLAKDEKLVGQMRASNFKRIKFYDINKVRNEIMDIYNKELFY